jgi:hypothetical protein
MPTEQRLRGFFEGTWETRSQGIKPSATGSAQPLYDTFVRLGQRESGIDLAHPIVFVGRGNFGEHGRARHPIPPLNRGPAFSNSWSFRLYAVNGERRLVGRWWASPWGAVNYTLLPPHQEFMPVDDANKFTVVSGQVFFDLTPDGRQFTGGFNQSGDPSKWMAWDGRKISNDSRLHRNLRLRDWPDDESGWPRDTPTVPENSITAPPEIV